jgi:hypothetical protein
MKGLHLNAEDARIHDEAVKQLFLLLLRGFNLEQMFSISKCVSKW